MGLHDLSEKKKAKLCAADRCFLCEKVGHLLQNCPKTSTAKSMWKGKLPGVAINSLELNFNEIDHLQQLAESTTTTTAVEGVTSWLPLPLLRLPLRGAGHCSIVAPCTILLCIGANRLNLLGTEGHFLLLDQ